MKHLLIIFMILFLSTLSYGVVLNVPEEYENIQAGIDAANNGDTVLVFPGTYFEGINFNSKSIMVASLALTTGDKTYRDSTIIDGSDEIPCIWIEGVERNDAFVYGFTIQHGSNSLGGGIHCSESVASISNCLIRWNTAIDIGGGIACLDSDIYMEYCIIRENEVDNAGGGGIYLRGGHSALWWCDISYNSTDILDGGGLYCTDSNPIITNCTIAYNSVDSRGGGVFFTGGVRTTLRNTIMWGNEPQQMWLSGENWITVDYSDIQGGIDDIRADHVDGYIFFDEGNFEEFPMFVDRRNHDLRLSWDSFPVEDSTKSPCIDVGDPQSPLDPDHTIADVGAFFFEQTPLLFLDRDTVYFETTRPGMSDWQTVILENQGGGLLQIQNSSIIPEDLPFSIRRGGGQVDLEPGSPHEIWLNFFPFENGHFEAVLRLETNYEERPVIDIALYAATLGVDDSETRSPHEFKLNGVFPNPFNSIAAVRFTLQQSAETSLKLYDIEGSEVRNLFSGNLNAGDHNLMLNADGLASGEYILKLTQGDRLESTRVVLIR
ncbi:MAG: T9SS type A sorting domain-containing protein [Calditrichaeota bacterium]|nr:T9SS type A sorting domain-containing protein [Calditrichota bacterium]MBT7788690.1 T9SS type A sorting domain-containing protein [Calditrichota bacterium]